MSDRPSPAPSATYDAVALADAPRDPRGSIDLDAVTDRLRHLGPVHVLRSSPGIPGAVPWSYTIPAPRHRLVDAGQGVRLVGANLHLPADPFDAIDVLTEHLGLTPWQTGTGTVPFTGGLVGSLAYDLGRRIERLHAPPPRDREAPELVLDLADIVVAVDHRREEALLVRRRLLDGDLDQRWRAVREALDRPVPTVEEPSPVHQRLRSSSDRATYTAAVATGLDHIARGEVFQVNLAHRLTARWAGSVHGLDRALRARSPAPHAAVLDGPLRLASISPETFLVADGRHVRTRPIKGTRPRGATPDEDRRLAAALTASPKDRAENVMVVDMERNDLGRVCQVGSVHVPELLELEAHPTVWHLVSTIDGTLRDGVGWGALLRATFPSGSITGTPKVRAMRLIDELEGFRRGPYCGAIGWLGAGGARLSVAIRTAALATDGTVDYAVGAGIVADSDPAAEYLETLAKARAFVQAVNGVPLD